MSALGVIALLLTLGGTYVLAESIAVGRMREMGIRASLGATGNRLAMMILTETVCIVGIGLGAGLLLAWIGARTIRTFLFGVGPLDPLTLATTAGLILLVAVIITLWPAMRVARVDVARVLRQQ
jgi:putative ABC transport system permease protein